MGHPIDFWRVKGAEKVAKGNYFVLKTVATKEAVVWEHLCSKMYRLLGVLVPDTFIVRPETASTGKYRLASQFIEGYADLSDYLGKTCISTIADSTNINENMHCFQA